MISKTNTTYIPEEGDYIISLNGKTYKIESINESWCGQNMSKWIYFDRFQLEDDELTWNVEGKFWSCDIFDDYDNGDDLWPK